MFVTLMTFVPALTRPVAQERVFRSRAEAVLVDVSVRLGNQVVLGLTKDDFELRDNGVTQAIMDLTTEVLPLDVSFTLDVSESVNALREGTLTQAIQQVSAMLRPPDRSGLTIFRTRILERVPLGPSPIERMPSMGDPRRGASLWDALALTLVVPPVTERRQLSIVLTDGLDSMSFFDPAFVSNAAKHTGAILHVILDSGGRSQRSQYVLRHNRERLKDIAETTGGLLVELENEASLSKALLQSIGDLRTSYVLRYTPTGVSREGWHELTLKMKKPGKYDLHARKGYWSR